MVSEKKWLVFSCLWRWLRRRYMILLEIAADISKQ
jgi:hypothetical protein